MPMLDHVKKKKNLQNSDIFQNIIPLAFFKHKKDINKHFIIYLIT